MPDRVKRLKSLLNTPSFYQEVFSPTSEYIENAYRIRELLSLVPNEIKSSDLFRSYMGKAVAKVVENEISSKRKRWANTEYPHGNDYVRFIRYCNYFIDDEGRSKLLDLILAHNRNFYSGPRKNLGSIASTFLKDGDSRALEVLQQFYRVLPAQTFHTLIDKIPDGLENENVKTILSKTKLFDYLKYDEQTVNNSFDEKVELTRAVAQTPTLIKRLSFTLEIDASHIKKIPPATRFKFLQFAFKHEIQHSKYGWYFGDTLKRRIQYYKNRAKEDKLIVKPMSLEEMKEILFSVCLHKSEEFRKWLTDYEIYLTSLVATQRVNVTEIKAKNHV